MTEKRFQWIYIQEDIVQINDNGIVRHLPPQRLEELLNELQMKYEAQRELYCQLDCVKNRLYDENEKLKQKNKGLQSELHIFKEDVTHSNKIIDKLNDENEQLKKELENNIASYKKCNRRVFDLIDKKIKEVDTIGAEVLKDLRRELME